MMRIFFSERDIAMTKRHGDSGRPLDLVLSEPDFNFQRRSFSSDPTILEMSLAEVDDEAPVEIEQTQVGLHDRAIGGGDSVAQGEDAHGTLACNDQTIT